MEARELYKAVTSDEAHTQMSADDYRKARADLNMNLPDWLHKLGIKKSSHDSYSSGRGKVPQYVANHIETLYQLNKLIK